MTTVEVFAPAKINLTLHITGQRDDGYHLLDSLVAFSNCGDVLRIQSGNTLSLVVEGPNAEGVPSDMNNLALKATEIVSQTGAAALTLEKYLPSASGIGGGSSDAAAACRGMLAFEGQASALDEQTLEKLLKLGADIPMCLDPRPWRVRGIGEQLESVILPGLPAVLINPGVPVHTADVFRGLRQKNNAPMPDALPDFENEAHLIDWLTTQRNDLEAPAIAAAPVIADVLDALRGCEGCQLARMSGSGATCFALFETEGEATAASASIKAAHPGWWVQSCTLA